MHTEWSKRPSIFIQKHIKWFKGKLNFYLKQDFLILMQKYKCFHMCQKRKVQNGLQGHVVKIGIDKLLKSSQIMKIVSKLKGHEIPFAMSSQYFHLAIIQGKSQSKNHV